MLIRCETCHALFSLQDGVVRGKGGEVPASFQVECGRCRALFLATAPTTLKGGPLKTPAPITGSMRPVKARPSGAAERPMQSAPTSSTLAQALKPKRPETEEEEVARLAQEAERRKRTTVIAIAGAGLIAILLVAGFLIHKRFTSMPAPARAKMEKARQKMLLDDLQSLEQAADLDRSAAALAPGEAAPEGERAFALLLAAGAEKDFADRGEWRARELGDGIAKLQIDKPENWEKQVDAIVDQIKQVKNDREPHVREATRLLQQGLAAAKAALEEEPDEPAALRAMALYSALNESPDRGLKFADKADSLAPGDPFTTYVRAQLFLAGSPSRDKQDKGLAQLALVRQLEPHLLRALYDAASIEVDRQQPGPAREKLDKLLAENPKHERAQSMRASLPAAQ